jgi:hypothetical protein
LRRAAGVGSEVFSTIERGFVLPLFRYWLRVFRLLGLLLWTIVAVGQLQPLGPFVPAVDVDAQSVEDCFLEGLGLAVLQVAVVEGRLWCLLRHWGGVLGRDVGRARVAILQSGFLAAAERGKCIVGAQAVGDVDGVEARTARGIFILHVYDKY